MEDHKQLLSFPILSVKQLFVTNSKFLSQLIEDQKQQFSLQISQFNQSGMIGW